MNTAEAIRWVFVALVTVALVANLMTMLLRWSQVSVETRNKGAAFIPVLMAMDYSAWYAIRHGFTLNPAIWWVIAAFVIFDAVWVYYLVEEIRK